MNISKMKVTSKKELKTIIRKCIEKKGIDCDLNFIDVSSIKDLSELFYGSFFNGDISHWDFSNLLNHDNLF